MNLPIIPKIKSVTDLRYQTAEIINLLDQDKPVVITKDSNAVAIMFSPKSYQKIVVMMEQMEEKEDIRRLEKAIETGDEFEDFSSFDQRRRLKRQ